MEVIIPIDTEVKIHGNPTLFRIFNKVSIAGVSKYQLTAMSNNTLHGIDVAVTDLIIVNNRELYKKVIEQVILTKKELVKSINQDIKEHKIVLGELEKFSSDETELLDLIDKFKIEKPSVIQRILKLKEHIDFSKFLGEWA